VPVAVIIAVAVVVAVLVLTSFIITTFLRSVDAGEILLASRGRSLHVYRGPCKVLVVPVFTQTRLIPAQAINVDIDITDQTADADEGGPQPVKVTVQASAIVSVGESDEMVVTAANKFFSKATDEQLSTLTDVLSSAGRRAINLLWHDQLFNASPRLPGQASTALATARAASEEIVARAADRAAPAGEERDDELALIIKDACSRELRDLGLSFNSLNIRAVLSEVAEARRRESAARAKASADVVTAQQQQRARIAQLQAEQAVNDQQRLLDIQIANNAAAVAKAEAARQAAVEAKRRAELGATQITQARADAEQNYIAQEAEGRAQATRIRAVAEAEADAIRKKAESLAAAGGGYLDLRRLELAPALTHEVAAALSNGQFVNLGTDGRSAASSGTEDVMRVVQTLVAARVIGEADHRKER
jgi:flotillin